MYQIVRKDIDKHVWPVTMLNWHDSAVDIVKLEM